MNRFARLTNKIPIKHILLVILVIYGLIFCTLQLWPVDRLAEQKKITRESLSKKKYCPIIDVLYTWVNGSDPHIQAQLQKYGGSNSYKAGSRLRDYNVLQYSVRSVEKFLPWVNKIWIVTDGQSPTWLNLSSPKVKIISHEEIFSDITNLPTFNSNAIESSLINLPSKVADCFFFLNDDVFFSSPILPSDFIDQDTGSQYIGYSGWKAPKEDDAKTNIWHHSVKVSNQLLNRYYYPDRSRIKGHYYAGHTCHFVQKRTLLAMATHWRKEFETTATHRFRNRTDIALPFLNANVAEIEFDGKSSRYLKSHGFYSKIGLDTVANQGAYARVNYNKPICTCFNDGFPELDDSKMVQYNQAVKELNEFFEKLVPTKSTAEKI